ncbi:MAG: serine/threonine protein kinase [Candidatus Abyssobacteria bacterium SURF_5]|uniref:non-specific serine/threonine protein kinase n=1 Tax=Abyssobacteria bacterium (strain SURF_5) TaxID=2093360 RepID=A0A3A4NSP2_ABYX5|nr:MAG: serine/threonine protein kinase [Candidatus Abyssubacteria bacterium SURF_5]
MYCDHCGAENRNNANFCHKCGTDLSALLKNEKKSAVATLSDAPAPPPVIDESTARAGFQQILSGRYELKEFLGRGGMGMVFRGYDKQLGMDLALKFLLSRYADDLAAIESLKREAKAAMRLAHPNIVRLYNFEDTPQLKYLLMEYVRGESLAALAAKRTNRRLSEPEVIRFMCEICEALSYSHKENIIHRDIKPGNILVTTEGKVKLGDFGIALINEKAVDLETDEVSGTPSYMSPEQTLGQPLDGRTDLYSLSITMYEMLAGKPPFRGKHSRFNYISMVPDPIEGVSDWLNAILLKCLRKEPEGRWSSAEELRDVLLGKKEGGLALKAKFRPWWVVAEDLKRNELPPTAPDPEPKEDIAPPVLPRAEVQRTLAPSSASRTKQRVEKVGRYAGLLENASERDQARIAYGTTAGIIAGILLFLISKETTGIQSPRVFLHFGFTIYGGFLGVAVGFAHKKFIRGALSFSFGLFGGILTGLFIPNGLEGSLIQVQPPVSATACAAVIGALLGVADGIYCQSINYTVRCAVWGAFGGAAATILFMLIRHLFSAFWSPLPHWVILGLLLGFSIMMGIGLARKPAIEKYPSQQ